MSNVKLPLALYMCFKQVKAKKISKGKIRAIFEVENMCSVFNFVQNIYQLAMALKNDRLINTRQNFRFVQMERRLIVDDKSMGECNSILSA